MLQPRRSLGLVLVLIYVLECVKGQDYTNTSPRKRRENDKDITTVLLVDNHGKNSLGRFLNVKPDLGLITSTARTFIQDGVTTEYATQVLGTTLDNGRLYAHVLTKTSRVVYDHDSKTKTYDPLISNKQWNLDDNQIVNRNFVRNTDFISPERPQAVYVFPTSTVQSFDTSDSRKINEQELLKEEQSNNARVPFRDQNKQVVRPMNIDLKESFQKDHENLILHSDNPADLSFKPSKVKAWDNLPTFTVRNEFSPSGFSYLGEDLSGFDSGTERSRLTTQSDRKARLLFKAGLIKPNPKDLQTVTYTGFADFTTTVANTVIVFTPHTSEVNQNTAQVTKIVGEPTIRPTEVYNLPFATQKLEPQKPTTTTEEHYPTFITTEELPSTTTEKEESIDDLFDTSGPNTMVINKEDRDGKIRTPDEPIDLAAKFAVLANEQKQDGFKPNIETGTQTIIFTEDVIQPSETQPTMLSTPSDEDIAKILASLQAQAAQMATQPLETAKSETVFFDEDKLKEEVTAPAIKTTGGATTIFFDDDDFSFEPTTTQSGATTPSEAVEVEKTTATTEGQRPIVLTTTEREATTTEKHETTTLEKQEETTTQEITTTTETEAPTTHPIVQNEMKDEEPEKNIDPVCTEGMKIVPSTVYKTLTYLTTFFIPLEESTSTSIRSNVVVSSQVSSETVVCDDNGIQATQVAETTTEATKIPFTEPLQTTTEQQPTTTTEKETESPTTLQNREAESDEETTTLQQTTTLVQEITTESHHVTESEPETTEATTEDGDEVELIFKTLYTTYTYLTTYFQDSTSSVDSRIVVTTNVITSTLDPNNDATDPAVAGLLNENENIVPSRTVSFDDLAGIRPTVIGNAVGPAQEGDDDDDQDDLNLEKATPALDDKYLQTANGVKTFYTTYTYFTTIFVDGETEISSRTEVYTNYVTPTALSENNLNIEPTRIPGEVSGDDEQLLLQNRLRNIKFSGHNNYNSINRQKPDSAETSILANDDDNNVLPSKTQSNDGYVTLKRGETSGESKKESDNDILDLSEYDNISTMVTDVRSSTSKGDERIIDNVDKRNVLLDDQIVSESNNDSEIIPSPALLLQTSYTTFTYFTTMYHGTTSSDIVSRLETVTNIVTSTLTPTQTVTTEEATVPVTYFTTFTYWTTFYKDGQTKVTSREETVSNVVTPGFEATDAPEGVIPLITSTVELNQIVKPTATLDSSISQTDTAESVITPSTVGEDELTTFYTTYTYYTTSYIGDETVLNSRLETVTNVLNNSQEINDNQIGRAINAGGQNQIENAAKEGETTKTEIKPTGLLSTIVNTIENDGIATVLSTDVFGTYIDGLYAKVLESTSSVLENDIAPSAVTEILKPTGVVSINQGKIVDADGISTLFYTTQAVGTYIDNLYAQVIESTSSLAVDQEKKAALGTDVPVTHRTGLVRLIEGSIIQNQTTTLYESKVLGTLIDGRYAQIIESTSSFILPNISPSTVVNEIVPTATKVLGDEVGATVIAPTAVVLEGSLTDNASKTEGEESSTEETSSSTEENEDEDKDDEKTKTRLTFQSKKRTFTPAIRPFASRQRPTFAPKRGKTGATTAATITRSDFLPTVTAVLASKVNRFGGRRGSSANQVIQPTASGGRRFSRPKATSSSGRRSSTGQIKPTSSGFRRASSSRASGLGGNIRSSSLYAGNSRFRIRPTAATGLSRSPSSKIVTETPPDGAENDLTTTITDNPTDSYGEAADTTLPIQSTTESSRRTNPLLRLRRPPLARSNQVSRTTSKPSTRAANSPVRGNNKATTTTAKPKTTRPNALFNRARAGGLFPRRNLFTTTTTPAPEEEEEEEEDLEEEGEENFDDDDTDYESSQQHTQTESAPTTPTPKTAKPNLVQIKPFRRRSKRQATYSRFRRPTSRTTVPPPPIESEEIEESSSPRGSPFRNRYQTNKYRLGKSALTTQLHTTTLAAPRKRISPTKPQVGRTQFTLREKDSSNSRSSNYKPRTSTNRRTTAAPRSNSRLRSGYLTESTVRRTTASNRGSSRTRGRVSNNRRTYDQNLDDNYVVPRFDGTITVTHQIPTEATIPVVNGKITEYKNIVTAKLSTEILNPRQYSTSINPYGKEVKVLLSENTAIDNLGATLITQFVLNETPTTTVIFTPTQIRGRKTSFSHVIPSTVYQVDEVVNTIQPALAAQAPLANILLSQLLLGGGVPQNQLLGFGQNNPGLPTTPTTEFKTRTTTYVTTVTSTLETVIPLTFRGKEILTTISEVNTEVVTATEFVTDTIVATPTQLAGFGQAPQFNTLLLPLLQQQLQQQQLQQQQANQFLQPQALLPQSPANVYNLNDSQSLPQNQAIDDDSEDYNIADDEIETPAPITAAPKRKPKKNRKKPTPPKLEPPRETSVITLYVSGRTPGEFTTVLSTITVGEDARRKRDISPVRPSKVMDHPEANTDYFDRYVEPTKKEITIEASDIVSQETESLESIIGDVPKHLKTKTPDLFGSKPTKATKKYTLKYVRASDDKIPRKATSDDNFLV